MLENYVLVTLLKWLFGFLISNFFIDAFNMIRFSFRVNDHHHRISNFDPRILMVLDYWSQTKFQITCLILFVSAHVLLICSHGISSQYWNSLLFCTMATLTVQLIKKMLSPWHFEDVEVSRYLENDKSNVGSALAHAYVHNYLKIVLGNAVLVNGIRDYELTRGGMTLGTMSDSIPINEVKVDCKKLLILIPASGIINQSLLTDTDNGVIFHDELKSVVKNKDGKSERYYTNTLYRLTRKVEHKDVYFAGEFATPVSTLNDMAKDGVLSPEQAREQVRHFHSAFLDLLNELVEISDTCLPIYYEDSQFGALSEAVLRTLIKDMYLTRQTTY